MARRIHPVSYSRIIPALLVSIMVLVTFCHAGTPDQRTVMVGTTADNIQTAYQNERQGQAEYASYAAKADEEGFHQIASMFRAVSRGEEIHASVLRDLAGKTGLTLQFQEEPVNVRSTQENLQTAADDQAFERDQLYPKFIKAARHDKSNDAQQVFKRIASAESQHFIWFNQALKDPNNYTAAGAQFYVCPRCGAVERSVKDRCPACGAPRADFEVIS